MDTDRHRGRVGSENSGNPRLTVLVDAANHAADVGNLYPVALTRNCADNLSICHEVVDIPLMHEGMPECHNLLPVNGSHRACRTDAEIAVDQSSTDRLAFFEHSIIACMELAARPPAAERQEGRIRRKLVLEIAQARRIESARKEIRLLLCCAGFCLLRLRRSIGSLFLRAFLCFRGSFCPLLRRLPFERLQHITPLCLALRTRHLGKFLFACAQTLFLLRLFPLLSSLGDINRFNTRFVLHIRHRPERRHILNRRDKKCIGAQILQSCRKGTDKAAVHIDRTAAHSLENTADTLDKVTPCTRHDHALRAFSALHAPENLNRE